jgi:hypothetical protein
VHKANVIANVPFIPNDDPPRILQPGIQPFDFPTASVSPQRATILRLGLTPITAVRGNQFDAPGLQLGV